MYYEKHIKEFTFNIYETFWTALVTYRVKVNNMLCRSVNFILPSAFSMKIWLGKSKMSSYGFVYRFKSKQYTATPKRKTKSICNGQSIYLYGQPGYIWTTQDRLHLNYTEHVYNCLLCKAMFLLTMLLKWQCCPPK